MSREENSELHRDEHVDALIHSYRKPMSRDSAVGMATGCGWTAGLRFPTGTKYFFVYSSAFRSALGTTQWVQCAVSLGVKRPGREAEVKISGAPPDIMVRCASDNFTYFAFSDVHEFLFRRSILIISV
jgi:hypothetical protein